MRFRATKAGAGEYIVRLVDLAGDLIWSVRGCRFDASILDGSSRDVRLLSLGEALPSTGSGVVEDCVFVGGAQDPIGLVVGDAATLSIAGSVTVRGCDFRGLEGGEAVYVTPGDPNEAKLRLIDNEY
jgi:hypothetical protein